MAGADAAWVEPKSDCPHTASIRLDVDIPPPDASCESCGDVSESWTCMQCMQVLCGRYVAGHMKAHCEGSGEHHIACSYRDLSFWCFACDSYVDPYGQPVMREAFAKVHQQKFGEPAVMPPPRTPGWGAPTLELQ